MVGVTDDRDRGCVRAREWASLRIDGELSEIERLLLRRHLGRCPECDAFAESLKTTTAAIRSTPHLQPSRPLGPENPAPVRERTRVRVAIAATVAVAAGGLGVLAGVLIDATNDGSVPTAPRPPVPEIAVVPPPAPPPEPGTTTTATV